MNISQVNRSYIFSITAYFILLPIILIASKENKSTNKIPINQSAFTENKGQIIDQNNTPNPGVLYLLNTPGMNVQLRKTGFSYDIYSIEYKINPNPIISKNQNPVHPSPENDSLVPEYHFHRIDLTLVEASSECKIIPSAQSGDYLNYYTAYTPVGGIKNIRQYGKITYKDIYPAIDLEFYTYHEQGFKYNFVIHPGGKISDIKLKITGPDQINFNDGTLQFQTSVGDVQESIPNSYYQLYDTKVEIKAHFRLLKDGAFGLIADDEVPANSTLVIDPIPGRIWATYYGGSGYDQTTYIKIRNGYLYMNGFTNSLNNIATTGSFMSTYGGGSWDCFLGKLNSAGQPVWMTYFGGPGSDQTGAISLDSWGHIYMSGYTSSDTNIATPGAFLTTYSGIHDAFLAKFDSNGQRIWATYYGAGDELANGCATDNDGNVYISGITNSTTGIATSGSHQPVYGGDEDDFLVKFDSSGQRLWGTYYGGSFVDDGCLCATDGSGNIYLSGQTGSGNNISTPGSHQPIIGSGPGNSLRDGFLVKFDSNGVRQWGTYYGGTGDDDVGSLLVQDNGTIYFTGSTGSPNNISTAGSFQPVFIGPDDAYFAKFTTNGVRVWGTYYGGTAYENLYVGAIDDNGYVFLSGSSGSTSNIATPEAYQTSLKGTWDAILVKFTPNGQRVWGTYYGDTTIDFAYLCAVTGDTIYMTGGTNSIAHVATPGSHQESYGGGTYDGLLVKFIDCNVPDSATQITGPTSFCIPSSGLPFSIQPITNATSYYWTVPPGATIVSGQNTTSITVDFSAGAVSGPIRVRGVNSCWMGEPTTCFIHVLPRPVPTVTGSDTSCIGLTNIYTTEAGKTQYSWNVSSGGVLFSGGTPADNFANFIWNGSGPQWIKVNYTDTNGCSAASPTKFDLIVLPGDSVKVVINASFNNICAGIPVTFTALPTNGGSIPSYQWKVNGINAGTNSTVYTYSPNNGDIVACILTSSNTICTTNNPATSNSITMIVNPNLPVSVSVSPSSNPVCTGITVTFTATPIHGGITPGYQWKANGIIVGTNSSTYAYIPLNNDVITCTLTSSETCTTGNPAISNPVTMTVNLNLPVIISITASSNPFCIGGSVTFTATPTHGGITPSYQWKVNGLNVGINNSTYTYNPISGDLVTCVLTSSDLCVTGNPATSNSISMIGNTGLPAGVTIAAIPNPFCPGTSVMFTATPNNGGANPSYQWKVNGINAGPNAPVYTFNPANNDSVRCIMTSNLNCVSGNPATSNKIILSGTLAPIITFTLCFDSITTINAKPIKLKRGIPLGGTFSGPGVSANIFNPATAGIGTKIITYSYTNAAFCSASKTKTIIVQATPAFMCGNNLTDIRDGKSYSTIQIGSQCWMAANLNYGTMISSSSHQRDNCINEKYCYNDLVANCGNQTYYQWDEIMRYDDTPAQQGLCPPAWHVPTEAEWNTLFAFYTNNGFAGSPLKYSGFSGFNALLSGVNHLNRQWDFNDFATFFWSSTPYGPYKALSHGMNDYNPSVSFYPSSRANAFSIRCLKD